MIHYIWLLRVKSAFSGVSPDTLFSGKKHDYYLIQAMNHIEAAKRHFQRCLDKGMGDLEAMLAGIRYRLNSGGKLLNPTKRPPGYRSQKLRNYLKKRGARRTTLWGATAIRGDLEPEKKGHIIEFLKLVNELHACMHDEELLEAVETFFLKFK